MSLLRLLDAIAFAFFDWIAEQSMRAQMKRDAALEAHRLYVARASKPEHVGGN